MNQRPARPMMTVIRLASALLASSLMLATATAGERRVAVGEVHSAVARRGVDMAALLRKTVESEVAKIDPAKFQGKRRAILSVSLLEMGPKATQHGTLDTCKVVATVRDAARGSIYATLEGDARTAHTASALSTDVAMMRSAVEGMVVRLPEALK